MKLYRVQSNYVPANMSTSPAKIRSYTKLLVRNPYMAYNGESYVSLDIDFDQNTIKYDNLHVSTSALLLYKRNTDNCYLNIVIHADIKDITSTCEFQFFRNIKIKPTLIATDTHYYLLNVVTKLVFTCEVGVVVTEKEPYAIVVLDRQQLCECAVKL